MLLNDTSSLCDATFWSMGCMLISGSDMQLAGRAIGKKAGALDGQLFLIKQLLILREQIAPFEAEFAITEKDLDFSHMRSHMRRILGGQASIFSLSADNAMLQLVGRGPRIIESQVPSRMPGPFLCRRCSMCVLKAGLHLHVFLHA